MCGIVSVYSEDSSIVRGKGLTVNTTTGNVV